MQARHVARELTLLLLFQLEKTSSVSLEKKLELDKWSWEAMLLSSVRSLVELSQEQLETSAATLHQVAEAIQSVELNHPENLSSPIEAGLKAVPMPNSQETLTLVNKTLQAIEWAYDALRIPEMAALSNTESVRQFALRLIHLVHQHRPELHTLINECSEDWRVDRLVKLDRLILEMTIAEMKYIPSIDHSVSINEAVELAKQFSTEESYKYINGLLAKIEERLNAPPIEPSILSSAPTLQSEIEPVSGEDVQRLQTVNSQWELSPGLSSGEEMGHATA